jgi:CRP/FNR family transcriptional regulator, cyclic AMP receptor protein
MIPEHWFTSIGFLRTLTMQGPLLDHDSDPLLFLSTMGLGTEVLTLRKGTLIFAQGDLSNGLFFIQKGKVQLTVASKSGKEATLGILGDGDFLGEASLAGHLTRTLSATCMTDCALLHIETKAMTLAMSIEPHLSSIFLRYLLRRNMRYQEDLVDQLFNSSEKRLARLLLTMAQFGKEGVSDMVMPRISQLTLAEMVGTTRSRVSFFMNRFRKLGFIEYSSGRGDVLHVHSSLLNVILRDDCGVSAIAKKKVARGVDQKAASDSLFERGETRS